MLPEQLVDPSPSLDGQMIVGDCADDAMARRIPCLKGHLKRENDQQEGDPKVTH